MFLKTFPKDMFEFHGFMMGSFVDVTDLEVVREARYYVNNIEQDFDLNNFHEQFAKYIISFLNKPNLTVGEAIVDERNIYADQSLSLTGLTGNEFMAMDARRANLQGLYGKERFKML